MSECLGPQSHRSVQESQREARQTRMDEFRQFLNRQQNQWKDIVIKLALVSKDPQDTRFILQSLKTASPSASQQANGRDVMYTYAKMENLLFGDVPEVVGAKIGTVQEKLKGYDFVLVVSSDIAQEELDLFRILKQQKMMSMLVYIDGDKLDSFKSQKDAEKSAMKVIKELT